MRDRGNCWRAAGRAWVAVCVMAAGLIIAASTPPAAALPVAGFTAGRAQAQAAELSTYGIPRQPQGAPPNPQASLPNDPREVYKALNDLRPDGEHVFAVREVDFRRDVLSLKLTDGKLAFFQPLGGHVTGAVFTGAGHILATPRDAGERRSLAQFLGVPILDQSFSRAYFRFTDDTATELQQLLRDSDATEASDPAFAQGWGAAVGTLNPSQSLRVMFDLLSTDPQTYFYAGIASEAVGVFDAEVDSRRDEQVVLGRTRIVNGAVSYDVWASFHALNGPAPFHPFTPVDYVVDTTIADDMEIEGKTTVHLKAARGGERIVPLELSRNLAVEQVQTSDGRALVYFQNEELSRREILERGNDLVMVALPAPAKAGEDLRFEVRYRGRVIADAGNGVKFVGEHETWYAHLAGEDAFVPFDLTFRWPRRLTLVATGNQVDAHEDATIKRGRWISKQPCEVAGFNLGEYKTENAGNEHLPVRIYANRQLEEAILERLRGSMSAEDIPGYVPPAFSPRRPNLGLVAPPLPPSPAMVMKNLGAQILDSVSFFEKLNGKFPFDHLDVSQIPGTSGQGWPGFIYLSTLAFLPVQAQAQAGFNERAQEEAHELMAPHEVAHQWWGNVVDSSSYRDTWITEGMANYLALLWADSEKPAARRMETWLERYRKALTTPEPGSPDPPDEAGPLTLGGRLQSSKIPNAYDEVVYGKGAWVIHMLREMLRDPAAKDPDARFRDLLQTILADYRFRPFSTLDFQHEVEKKMTASMDLEGTRKMDWFFDEWVRSIGIPHYKVDFQVKARGTDFLVTGKLLQTNVDDLFTAPVPLYATHAGAKPTLLGVVDTTGPETRFRFVTKVRPTHLVIDPHMTLLWRPD